MQYTQPLTCVAGATKQPRAFWIYETTPPQLRTFSNEPIQVEGKIQAPITSKDWACDSATFTVVADGLKSLIGRNFFAQLGLAVTQSTSLKGNHDNKVVSPEFQEQIAKTFPGLVSRIGRSKSHVAKYKFHKNFQSRHQKVDVSLLTFKRKLILNLANC